MSRTDIRVLDSLTDNFDKLISKSPELKREFYEQTAKMLKQTVDDAIVSSGINDSHGNVRRWQVVRVGSKGGYAAISAERGQGGRNSPGAITGYLERGHRIRPRTSATARYKPLKVSFVSGYHFYETAAAKVDAEVIKLANQFADKLAAILEE